MMIDRKTGGLPVVGAGQVVGVITEIDTFQVFTFQLGVR